MFRRFLHSRWVWNCIKMLHFDPIEILRAARSLCDIPYAPNGCSREGCDCIGLVLLFYRRLGICIPYDNSHGYQEKRYLAQDMDILLQGCKKFFHLKSLSDSLIMPSYLLVFQHDGRMVSTHLGVAVTGHEFLHMDRVAKVSKIEKLRVHMTGAALDKHNCWSRKLKYVGKLRKIKWEA